MNHTRARCGHMVVAVGAPGSLARQAQELRTCDRPRCRSGLPGKFSDEECSAYVAMYNIGFAWVVDLVTKEVRTSKGEKFANLVEFAEHYAANGDKHEWI